MKAIQVKAVVGDTVWVWKRIKRRPQRLPCGFCGGRGKAKAHDKKLVDCPKCGGSGTRRESPTEAVTIKPLKTTISHVRVAQYETRDWKTDRAKVERVVAYSVKACHDSVREYRLNDTNIALTREELEKVKKPEKTDW